MTQRPSPKILDTPGVDLIGDVHGYYDEMTRLLHVLGYRLDKGVYKHPSGVRTALFLGDAFDRGDRVIETVTMQDKMVKAGSAQRILGNHEYNLRCMSIPHPEERRALRPRTRCNLDDTRRTRMQYRALKDGGELLNRHVADVYSIPVFYETPEFRVAHACWDPKNIEVLKRNLTNACLTPDHIIHAETKWRQTDLSTAVIDTLKGKEMPTAILLEHGFTAAELKKQQRTKRVAWWYENRDDIRKGATVPAGEVILNLPKEMRARPIPLELVAPYLVDDPDPRPVFFGHYCLKQPPVLTGTKYQCLDFGVIKSKGCLTAYRWNTGDKGLDQGRLVSVPRLTP